MFLSKKWILVIIGTTAISFVILLIIQFGWIRKSIESNRRHFADRMVLVSNNIRDAFLQDKTFYQQCLSDPVGRVDLFQANGDIHTQRFDGIVQEKLDSVLKSQGMPLSTQLHGRVGTSCYFMKYVAPELRSPVLDRSNYKVCLCTDNYPGMLDIGFDLSADSMLVRDSSGLILPSVILIFLLISLFSYVIYIINRQKKLADLKNDFINNLTHEFNTPLFSIGLTSSLLQKSDPVQHSEKLKGYVDLITTEKNRLQTQVDKMLRMTAVESDSQIMEKVKLDMHAVIEQNIAAYSTVVGDKSGSLQFEPGVAQFMINGDPVHMYNAISNLIDNAVKYSQQRPEIMIRTQKENNEGVIQIADHGIGLTKSDESMIFDKFYRVKQGDRHDVKGFGIGLSYVKKVIELHGGKIDVSSRPGEGSVFIIRLPILS